MPAKPKNLPEQTHDPKSWRSDDELACAIRDLHKFLAANLGAASKRDLEKGLKQLKDEILQELKGQIMTLKEQLDAQKAQLDTIGTDVDGIVESVNGINADVQALKAKIDQLQNSPGAITPEDQALLDQIQSQISGLSAKTTAARTAVAKLDADTEPDGGSGDGGQT